jgi:hypothetical protein
MLQRRQGSPPSQRIFFARHSSHALDIRHLACGSICSVCSLSGTDRIDGEKIHKIAVPNG